MDMGNSITAADASMADRCFLAGLSPAVLRISMPPPMMSTQHSRCGVEYVLSAVNLIGAAKPASTTVATRGAPSSVTLWPAADARCRRLMLGNVLCP